MVSRKVGLTLATIAVGVAAISASAATNGRIAFVSDRAGDLDIWTMNADGSDAFNITDAAAAPGFDLEPAVSANGSTIAFRSGRADGAEIYTVRADGTGLKQLTANTFKDYAPAWSPDGTKIAFSSNRNDPNSATCVGLFEDCVNDIFVMPATGGAPVQVTFDNARDQFPAFSPNGRFIAYVSNMSGAEGIYKVDLQTLAVTKLTPDGLRAGWPAWSPDGTRIAFSSNFDACHKGGPDCRADVYVMNADGSSITQLTEKFRENGFNGLSWSPRGDRIAFTHSDETPGVTPARIYVMNADGSDVTRISRAEDDSFGPSWAP